jgi:hypothetical protein
MQLRMFSAVALATGAIGSPLFTAATTTKYKIRQLTEQEIDATALGGGKQSVKVGTTGFVTVTLTDSSGGKAMHVVVDSMQADSGSQVSPAALDSLKGAAFHAFVSPAGKVEGLKAMKDGGSVTAVQGLITDLFPRAKAGVRVGDGWTDTTETTNNLGNGSMSVRKVTNWKAAGNETREGAKALKIDAAFSASMAGSQETPGGTANIEGTGSGNGSYFVGNDGRYLGGDHTQTSALSVTVASAPAPIPITVKQTTNVSMLK